MYIHKDFAMRQARRFYQQGLTLIELLVVLVILVALAGILIPQLPNMITKAHTASSATSLGEANKAVQHFEQLYLKDPNNLDNLVPDATGANLIDYLPALTPTSTTTASGTDVIPVTLDTNSFAALNAAGITTVSNLVATKAGLDSNNGTPTFNPYNTSTPVTTLTSTSVVSGLAVSAVVKTLRPNAGAKDVYVAFGIGQNSDLTGHTINTAPYHFDDDTTAQAVDKYTRFLAVYKVEGTSTDGTTSVALSGPAQFVGVVGMHSDGVINSGNEVGDYLNTNKLN